MKRLRQLAADLVYVIDTYGWVPMALVLVLLTMGGAIDNPVLNPQTF
jgi:hypothetical protein